MAHTSNLTPGVFQEIYFYYYYYIFIYLLLICSLQPEPFCSLGTVLLWVFFCLFLRLFYETHEAPHSV